MERVSSAVDAGGFVIEPARARLFRYAMTLVAAVVWIVVGVPLACGRLVAALRRIGRGASQLPEPQREPPMPRRCRRSFVTVRACRFQLTEAGLATARAGRLVLLLHGFPQSAHCWRHVLEALGGSSDALDSKGEGEGDGVRFVALDLRGYGGSVPEAGAAPWPHAAFSMPSLVADVREVISALGFARAAVVGHDWGGMIAWAFAAAHPEMVSRLCVIAAPHPASFAPNIGWIQAWRSLYVILFQMPWLPELYISAAGGAAIDELFFGRAMGVRRASAAITAGDAAVFKGALLSRAGALTDALLYYRNVFGINSTGPSSSSAAAEPRAAPLPMPVLQVWSDCDGALGLELTRGTAALCTDYRLVVLPNCSHWAAEDAPGEVVALLSEFLTLPVAAAPQPGAASRR